MLCGLIECNGTRTSCHLPEWGDTIDYIITTKDCANATISCQTHDDYLPVSAVLDVQASGNSQPPDFEGNRTKLTGGR